MANPGAKFVSVNLNKSYGQQQQSSYHHHYSHYNGGGSYGQAAPAGRGRSGSGGGGGMVVLSRNRGSSIPKAVPKLSVPPPLNLPSLRKEHEKFDMAAPGGGPGGGAGITSGSRPSSSGVGWTKPVAAPNPVLEKIESAVDTHGIDGTDVIDGVNRGVGSYMPPSARSNGVGVVGSGSASRDFQPSVDKAMVLRGEDFPSLQAVRPTSSGTSHKQKDGSIQKQKLVVGEESTQDKRDSYHLGPLADMHPSGQLSRSAVGNGLAVNGGDNHEMDNRHMADHKRKQEEFFPDPLSLVRLNPRSDWADDERDTGHGFTERERDIGHSKSEYYWDRDFDFPRPTALPNKPAQNHSDRWGHRDNEAGKNFSSEVLKMDPYPKDLRASSREGREASKWRASTLSKDGSTSHEVGNERNDVGTRVAGHSNMVKENKYIPPHYSDSPRDGSATLSRDSTSGRRDLGFVGRQQPWMNSVESYNHRGADRNYRDHHSTEQTNRYRGDNFQSNTFSKSFITSSGKVPPVTDHIPAISRDKRYSKVERPFVEDPFLRDLGSASFDETDLFSGGLIGVIKRKKDAAKSTNFHDPVRESFEAELERVQKIQELERQRIIEEQERALEQARREEEERHRRIREEEERQRRLEEDAREAAWKAEQERLEAIRRAEEQRISREEDRRKMLLEEERRKQAAKQKLLELEAKIAQRQAEAAKGDVSLSSVDAVEKPEAAVNEKDMSKTLDLDTWEDRDRMVEKGNMSTSFDSSGYSRPVEMSSRPYPPGEAEGPSNLPIRGWRRDGFENGGHFPSLSPDQEIGHYSPMRGASSGGRSVSLKDFHGGAGYMSSRSYSRAGTQDPYADDFGYQKDHRWSIAGEGDSYVKLREMDSEIHDIVSDKYGDNGWGQGRSRGGTRSPYLERLYPYGEPSELYTYGRSRNFMRQPRVLPPPLTSAQRSSFGGVSEQSGSSSFLDDDNEPTHVSQDESNRQMSYYNVNEGPQSSSIVGGIEGSTSTEGQKLNNASRCDSPSSLSVSSPPTSPPHLSHDELDVSGDSPVASAVPERKINDLNMRASIGLNDNSGKDARIIPSDSVSAVDDEEWPLESNDTLQQQEEYDEDEDGYREEDDVRDDEHIDLNQNFVALELEEGESSHMMDNVVLGFDEGVEVVIPNDDSEKNTGALETSFGIPEASVGVTEERELVGGIPLEEHSLLPVDNNSFDAVADSSSLKIPENRSVSQGSVSQSDNAPYSTVSDVISGPDYSGGTGSRSSLASSGDVSAITGSADMQSLSSAGCQSELPVKLQFGLFSGPSLIPSPVPAIQIGSIQMPLHIHAPVGPSLAHMHPSQPPMYQFGQLRYTSPISQGILQVAPPSMSFVQPNIQGHYNSNQNARSSVPQQPARDTFSQDLSKDGFPSLSTDRKPSFVHAPRGQSSGNFSPGLNNILDADNCGGDSVHRSTSPQVSGVDGKKINSESVPQAEEKQKDAISQSSMPSSKERGSESQSQHLQPMMHSVTNNKGFTVPRGLGPLSGGKVKRFAYAVKNLNSRSSFHAHDAPADSNSFPRRPRRTVQRTEFRIRETNDWRQPPPLAASNNNCLDDKSNSMGKAVGVLTRSGSNRGNVSNRTMKQRTESEPSVSANVIPQEVSSEDRGRKEIAKDLPVKSQNASHQVEVNLRRNVSEEDVDAPLQSGVVRVFKQSGIEAPSDEDDFIEVRSKRQMLNDRREQREKEIKAKSRSTKPLRKPRPTRQNAVFPRSNKLPLPLSTEESRNSQLDFIASERSHLHNKEVSTGSTPPSSQPLAPVGTPSCNSEPQAKSSLAEAVSTVSDGGTDQESGMIFESKNKVMSLTQTQLDEAMQPARYDSNISTVENPSGNVNDPILPSPSILTKDKVFSSAASPINSFLAGEKIQFGAVVSPTVLPPTSRVLSHGIGAPGSNRTDVQASRNFPVSENDSSLFFGKEKHPNDLSAPPLQDCEAEAEAAASAVAVAAISNDEIVGNNLGSVNVPETKSFDGSSVNAIATGVIGDQQLASQSRGEELSVSLPADLSVETTPISLWPSLASPQSSSSQMHSHFPGGPHSHFPFYEMNPMLGGPIFTFSPHEESSVTQSQPQKTTASTSGPLGNWQHGVDSFYGPAAGYPGPYISPGGLPGVQGPPHMVVYNHFAPVGQYGQVGLSFMGTTYIPSGKQADWKHTPSSSAMHSGEGELSNMNMAALQRNAPNMTVPVQHLAPGSPLLPIASPLPMFDVSPFQPAPDLSVQARWGHITASPLHSVPVSRPLQPQVEVALPSQMTHGHSIDQSLNVNRYSESRIPAPSDNGSSFAVVGDDNVSSFPAELRLVDTLKSNTVSSGQNVAIQTSSASANAESEKSDTLDNGIGNSGKNHNGSSVKSQFSQKNATIQHGNSNNYNYHRGSMSHRNNAGNEWSHRRMGFHGRNQPVPVDKVFPVSKVKQIYVAKQTTSTNPAT